MKYILATISGAILFISAVAILLIFGTPGNITTADLIYWITSIPSSILLIYGIGGLLSIKESK
jgi:hypothetical protein